MVSTPLQRDEEIVRTTLRDFSQMRIMRHTFEAHWEEVAELVLPTSRNTFTYGSSNWQGEKKTDRQVDATGMMALHRFGAICDSLLTPRNMTWHQLTATNPELMKDRNVRLWFEQVTRLLFKYRYSPAANYSSQNQNVYQSLGAFGTASLFIDKQHDGMGLRYMAMPLGETFFKQNHQGLIDTLIRWFRLTARQTKQKWPDVPLPGNLQTALEQGSETPFNFLHHVFPRDEKDYDPQRLDARGKKFASCYVCIEGQALMGEGGYYGFPVAPTRYDQTPSETYGRGPAMMVLPALKTLNAEKRTFLKAGHRAADPVLLTHDDGLMSWNMRPGAINPGGMNSDGRPLVGVLPVGSIQISEQMMQVEASLINDAFLISLFQIMTESPQMTATEVIERTNEKGILLAPTMGRQQSEYLGPKITRELDLLAEMRLLPPMPPALQEAQGEYDVVYTSPLSRAARAQEAAGFVRTLEIVSNVVNITQDPAPLDNFNFDVAIPEIAEIQAVPVSWMAGSDQIMAKRQGRAKMQQQQAEIQAAPAQAAMIKAQAVAQKGAAK